MITKKGTVVNISGEQTIKVRVEEYRTHAKYHKRYRISKNFLVHDQTKKAKPGDTVVFQQSQPISKNKNYILTKITNTTLT